MLNCAHLDHEVKGAAPSRATYARYAIYYTPQPGTALAAFGRSWFGRANDGVTLQAFSDAGLSGTSFAKLVTARGRYTGLHALFRAPFALRDGFGPDALKTRLINFTARRKPVATGPLTLSRAGRYLVLRPVEATPALREKLPRFDFVASAAAPLNALRPAAADSVAAVVVDPAGLLMLRYEPGYDPAGVRQDLSRLIR